jgi:hypothetical protein
VKRLFAILAVAGLSAACTVGSKPTGTPAPVTLAATLGDHPTSAPVAVSSVLLQAAVASPAPPAPKLLCDAASLAYLVGRKRTEIPVPADLSRRRVACTTCPASEDHRPERTDILFDQRTGLVAAVTCG